LEIPIANPRCSFYRGFDDNTVVKALRQLPGSMALNSRRGSGRDTGRQRILLTTLRVGESGAFRRDQTPFFKDLRAGIAKYFT
jgi:hypothetical protein